MAMTEDDLAEERWLARQERFASKCKCEDLPMYCPGPANCPYSGCGDDEDEADEVEE